MVEETASRSELLRSAQDFACGLRRPQDGSTSTTRLSSSRDNVRRGASLTMTGLEVLVTQPCAPVVVQFGAGWICTHDETNARLSFSARGAKLRRLAGVSEARACCRNPERSEGTLGHLANSVPSLRSGFRLRARTPANRLNFTR